METKWHPRFHRFIDGIEDRKTRQKILSRITMLEAGNPGDSKAIEGGVRELKIDYGPGWRVYYARIGSTILMILAGGSKRGQQADIDSAIKLMREVLK